MRSSKSVMRAEKLVSGNVYLTPEAPSTRSFLTLFYGFKFNRPEYMSPNK